MSSGLASGSLGSGISSGLGSSLGTTAAGSAAGTAAAQAAGGTTAGSIGSAIGSEIGSQLNQGAGGDIARMFTNSGGGGEAQSPTASTDTAQAAASPSNTKGGWLGTGLFGNDQYNPNPSSYAPATGGQVAQAAKPKAQTTTPIALQLMQQLPITDPSFWRV